MSGQYAFTIDTYSAVWNDVDLKEVLDHYMLTDLFNGFWMDAVPCFSSQIYGDVVRFVYNNILITLWQSDFESAMKLCEGDFSKLTNQHFRKVTIAFSGSGLSWMRSQGIDVDSVVSVLRKQHDSMHVTRCDFAFDFINYNCGIDIFDMFSKFVIRGDTLSDSGRLCVRGHQAGLTFQRKYGSSEKTFYIGSPTSERVLRVYDKYLERKAASHGLFIDSRWGDPATVQSWVRIELQTRKSMANKMLYSENYCADSILEDICKFYKIYRSGDKSNFKSFLDYFSPETVHKHLVYANPCFCIKSTAEKNDDLIDRSTLSLLIWIMRHGFPALELKLGQALRDLQTPQDDEVQEDIRQTRLFKFIKRLCESSPNGELSGLPHVNIKDGIIQFPGLYNKS